MSDDKQAAEGRGLPGEILNIRRRVEERHRPGRTVIIWIGRVLAGPEFFFGLLVLHVGWVIANLPGLVPWTPWDGPPFVLLATIASAEAPFLTLLVLMRQEHDRRIAELREETALQVAFHSEREATANLRLLVAVARRLGIERPEEIVEAESDDGIDLAAMQRTLDPERLLDETREEIARAGEETP